jgi:hypothetical protein
VTLEFSNPQPVLHNPLSNICRQADAPGGGVRGLPQQLAQLDDLFVREARERAGDPQRIVGCDFRVDRSAPGGHLDVLDPPVSLRTKTPNQSFAHETVNHACEVAAGDVEATRELRHRNRTAAAIEFAQDFELRQGDVEILSQMRSQSLFDRPLTGGKP